jgi:UDP-N-acetyl-D-mannosaminuronic acid dehydrogenase
MAVLLATHGHKVIGIDIDRNVVQRINKGETPFDEPGLLDLLRSAIESGDLIARTDVEKANVFIIAVPTPLNKRIKKAELNYVRLAGEMVYPHLSKDNLVILESTVPPGTTEKLVVPLLEKSRLVAGRDFHVAFCPERAMPGNTISEMVHNDRVIGGIDEKSTEVAMSLYSSFVEGGMYPTDIRTAEFVKLIENTFRDVNIALANELAQVAEESEVNVWDAIELANKHPRVNIHKPGPGVGGHCLTKDPWFLAEESTRSRIIPMARGINDQMPDYVFSIIRSMLENVDHPVITLFGAAYKGGVGDTSETPVLRLLKRAEQEGYEVRIYDPHVKGFDHDVLCLHEAVKGSDCIVLMVDHPEFRDIDVESIAALMRSRNLVDTRNMFDREEWEKQGFDVKVLGNGKEQ